MRGIVQEVIFRNGNGVRFGSDGNRLLLLQRMNF